MQKTLRDELRDVISGKSQVRHGEAIQAIAHYLEIGSSASANPEKDEQIRSQEKKRLEQYVSQHQLWLVDIDLSKYVSEGAEQKVYLKDSESVFKLNDAIYYRSWVDYFRNLLLHNYFFNDTAYQLIGFYKSAGVVYAVVEQPFVQITQATDLNQVQSFLKANGFIVTRNNDYYNAQIGVILEDLHDENVLTKDGLLYFIDTVFFLTNAFWSE